MAKKNLNTQAKTSKTRVKNVANKETPRTVILNKTIDHPTQIQRIRQSIQNWRNALTAAENPYNPQRYNLLQLFTDIDLDAHATACLGQRKDMLLGLDFEVTRDDKRDDELSKMCVTQWFGDFLEFAYDSIPYGYSLIQFDSLEKDEFKEITLVDRIYVKPELGIVTPNYTAVTGVNFTEKPYSDWCIGVGKKKDLGLFAKLAPLVIWKKNAMGAWADFQDIFGAPVRIGKTNVKDDETRENMIAMLRDMAVAAWGVFDLEDELELIESKRADAFQVFNQMIERCNSEMSKLILGQTGTMDEKSFVGSAEVHERILENKLKSDKRWMKNILNKQLVPFLENLGFSFKGAKFNDVKGIGIPLADQAKIDIELIKTGKYIIQPDKLKKKYGSDVELAPEPTTPEQVGNPDDIKRADTKLKNLYSLS